MTRVQALAVADVLLPAGRSDATWVRLAQIIYSAMSHIPMADDDVRAGLPALRRDAPQIWAEAAHLAAQGDA